MGQEISEVRFDEQTVARFTNALKRETALCERWWADGRFAESGFVIGHELEAWLIDHRYSPYPINQQFLALAGDPMLVPELSRFNFEVNGTPQALGAGAFRALEDELARVWARSVEVAHSLEGTAVMIGILPTIKQRELCLANISPLNRYYALNERTLAMRDGVPIRVHIEGRETLDIVHHDVMLESAATSFQLHLQPPRASFARHFNASMILSAPLVALTANSPFLFGRDLWDETRIPLFEQAVPTGNGVAHERRRVTFGSGYLGDDAISIFRENLRSYEMLLPMPIDHPPEKLAHLRLQNGTIWRWNRPLLGFDDAGTPHLRIEQRVMPAGPTILDMVANAAFYVGAAHRLATLEQAPESTLDFETARNNFYRAARDGLDAQIDWLGARTMPVREVLVELIESASEGLRSAGVGVDEIDRYLDVVAARVRSGSNGATWQREHARRHGRDFDRLVADYTERQRSGMPVHEWDF